MHSSDARLAQLASQYLAAQAAQTKRSVGGDWDLEELEQAARAVLDEEAGMQQ
jgi:DNA-binding transcriptional regulator PaaX